MSIISFAVTEEAGSWSNASLTMRINSVPFSPISLQSWSYSIKLNSTVMKGVGAYPLDYTEGQFEFENVKVKMTNLDWASMQNTFLLNPLGNGGFAKSDAFDMTIQYGFPENGQVYKDSFTKCRVVGLSQNAETSPDPMFVELELQVLYITPGGLSLLSQFGVNVSISAAVGLI